MIGKIILSTASSDSSIIVDGIAVPVRIRRSARARAYRLSLDQARGELRLSLPMRGQPNAVGHKAPPLAIIAALPAMPVEQAAGDIGRIDVPRILILRLVQAAFAASVAQRFPLRAIKLVEGLFPEVQTVT